MVKAIRVLQVMATLDRGGAESVVMDWLRRIDRERVVFDFVVNSGSGPYALEAEARSLGGRIIRAPKFKLWNSLPYAVWWTRTLVRHPEWEVVHAHHTVPAFLYLSIARALGRKTIAHSHTAGGEPSVAGRARAALRWPLRYVASSHFACSRAAALWMFGERVDVPVVPNGIEVERFVLDSHARTRARIELGLEDAVVVGHVGSFRPPKNHSRLLRLFSAVLMREPRARLLLVGDGNLRGEIEDDIQSLGLRDSVVLMGVRDDIPTLLSTMDVLVFPSLYEGLPVTVVEAQATGLPCVVSKAVTPEVGLTDLVHFLSLDEPDDVWAVEVLQLASQSHRESRVKELREAGYDAAQVAKGLQELYLALAPTSP